MKFTKARWFWIAGLGVLVYPVGVVQAGSIDVGRLSFHQATCLGVLQELADQTGASLVVGSLPDRRQDFLFTGGDVLVALTQVRETFGVETAWWRGLILARSGAKGTVRQRMSQALSPAERRLVLRWRSSDADGGPGFKSIVTAVRYLATRKGGPVDRTALQPALSYMAGAQLSIVVAQLDGVNADASFFRLAPPRRRPGSDPTKDPCAVHAWVTTTMEELDPGCAALQCWRFHGPGYNFFQQQLTARKGLISVREYAERVTRAARKEAPPWPALTAASAAIQAGEYAPRLAALAPALKRCGLAASIRGAAAEKPLRVVARGCTAAEVSLAAAAVLGAEATPRTQPPTVTFAPATTLRARLETALPLNVWAAAHSTSMEQRWAERRLTTALFAALPPQTRQDARNGAPMRLLSPAARGLLRALVAQQAGQWWRGLRLNFPADDEPVPLCLYEDPQKNIYELAGPTDSEALTGWQYLAMKQELEHVPLVRKGTAAQLGVDLTLKGDRKTANEGE